MEVEENFPALSCGGIHEKETQCLERDRYAPLAGSGAPTYLGGREHALMPARRSSQSTTEPVSPISRGDYLETTRAFWQQYTDRPLSREDAREMAHNLLGFFSVLREWTLAERAQSKAITADRVQSDSTPAGKIPV
jgi:hypothetical protein